MLLAVPVSTCNNEKEKVTEVCKICYRSSHDLEMGLRSVSLEKKNKE